MLSNLEINFYYLDFIEIDNLSHANNGLSTFEVVNNNPA